MKLITKLRLIRQGFVGFSDAALSEFGPWLRLAPALCALVVLLGTFLENWIVLWAVVPSAAFAAITRKHPADLIYDEGIRRLLRRRERLPGYRAPRRFASALAAAVIFVAGLTFLLGWRRTGVVTGALIGGEILLAAATDISLGSLLYHAVMPTRGHRSPAVRASVTVMLNRRSITAPRRALRQRPQLRRTG